MGKNNAIAVITEEEFQIATQDTGDYDLGKQSVNEYIFSLTSKNSQKTMLSYLKLAVTTLDSDLNSFDWSRLKENLVIGLRTRLAQDHSPATVNTVLAAIKGVARRLWVNNILSTRDYELLLRVKSVRGSRLTKGRALSKQEIEEVFSCLEESASSASIRDRAMLSVMVECGLRRAEVAGLQYKNVHLDEDDPYLTIIGKGNKERMCFIPEKTVERLQEWFSIRRDFDGAVFTNVDKHDNVYKTSLNTHRVWEITKEIVKKLDMKSWSPHDMRRTFATNLFNLGVDIVTVKDMMGHSNIATTQRYDKRGADKMKAAVRKLNAS